MTWSDASREAAAERMKALNADPEFAANRRAQQSVAHRKRRMAAAAASAATRGAWHSAARLMRANGASVEAISVKLDKPVSLVKWALDIDGARDRQRARVRRMRGAAALEPDGERIRRRAEADEAEPADPNHPGPKQYFETFKPKPIRAVLPPPEIKMAAVQAFARGDIDRAQLSAVLRGFRP